MTPKQSFGQFAKSKRTAAGLGLRQAANQMRISGAYLSRVENNVDHASAELIFRMAKAYSCDLEELNTVASRPEVAATVRGKSLSLSEELRALYRIGGSLTAAEVEDMIRHVLKKRNMSDADIERELAMLRAELPRIRSSQREGLFAADIRPRFLSRRAIDAMAYRLLAEHGFVNDAYVPPTPVETLAEGIEGVRYEIRELPSKDGEPIVLGLTRRDENLQREVVINSVLADSDRQTDKHRFNFTLAHELFHAIEHLPLAPTSLRPGMMRRDLLYVEHGTTKARASRAQKAVASWAKGTRAHPLMHNEDWREWQANTFAAALLMPDWAVRRRFEGIFGEEFRVAESETNVREFALETASSNGVSNDPDGKTLAEAFAVSRQAMAIRLMDLGLVKGVTA
jgi:Zn-dependent peptidase ImmA (M78 family)/transcriptional regulator with XRE-family HTH domain